MCKQMEDLRNESLFEGRILTLIDLVEDGSLSIEKAAAKMNMTINEFREFKNKAPLPKGVVTRTEALSALDDMFKQAEAVPEMTLDEINAEIADERAAKKVAK